MSEPHEWKQEDLEIGHFKVGARGINMLLQALARGTPEDRLRTALREGFQNALDASLSASSADGLPRTITIDVDGEDVVLRDRGVGLTPKQINDLLLSIFETGKDEGLGGFGVGAGSVIQGAAEVIIRTRKAGAPIPGAEFRRSWAGLRSPELMDSSASEDFGAGTEITFSGIVSPGYESGKVSQAQVKRLLGELFLTSELPGNVQLCINGETISPAVTLGPHSRKMDADIQDTFPGALIEHHIVPLPPADQRRAPFDVPRAVIQLEDPRGSGWAITQWFDYLDDACGFAHIVRVRPTVRPDHDHYPFNYERTTIADDTLRNAIATTRQRFVTDSQTALQQQTWKHTYYTGTDDDRNNPSVALAESVRSEKGKARIAQILDALSTLPEGEVMNHLARRAQQISRSQGTAVTVDELIANQPTMVKQHTEWVVPDWAPRKFDPNSPKSIQTLAPLLTAMRTLGLAIRGEAADAFGYPFSDPQSAPFYGFIFSNTESGMLASEPDSPMGAASKFLLINPFKESFRTARTPEALCDALVSLLIHEHVHESATWHNEHFTIQSDTLHDRISNIRPELYRIFKETGAWKALRTLQGLPLRPAQPRPTLRRLDYREYIEVEREHLTSDLSSRAYTLISSILHFARDTEDTPEAAAVAVAELVGTIQETKILSPEELATLQRILRERGVRQGLPATIRPGSQRSDGVAEFQRISLRNVLWGDHTSAIAEHLGVPADGVDGFFTGTALSPAQLNTYRHHATEVAYGSGKYYGLMLALRDIENGKSIREAIEDRREGLRKEESAMLASPGAELILSLALIQRSPETHPPEAAEIARSLIESGKLPRRVAKERMTPPAGRQHSLF